MSRRVRRAISAAGRQGAIQRALPLGIVVVCVLVQTVLLTQLASTLWFIGGDDWDYLLKRGTFEGESRGWFAPHNGHWTTLVVAIYRLLFAFFGMRNYLPYALVGIAFHAAICLLIYFLLRCLGASKWASCATSVVVVFLGAGAQALLWDGPMPLVGSLLLGFGALYVVARLGVVTRGVRAAWVLLTASLMFSGVGVPAVILVAVFVLTQHGRPAALRVMSVPALAWMIWFVTVGHTARQLTVADRWRYLEVPSYIWTGLTNAVGSASGIPGAGATLLISLVLGTLLIRRAPDPLRAAALAGLCAGFAQMFLTAFTRLDGESATVGRYVYVLVVFFSPAIALLLHTLFRALTGPRLLVAGFVALLFIGYASNGVLLERQFTSAQSKFTDPWPDRIRGTVDASREGQAVLTKGTDEWFNEGFDASLIARPSMRRYMPTGSASPKARLEAERLFFTSVGLKSRGLLVPLKVRMSNGFLTQVTNTSGCSSHVTQVAGSTIALTTSSVGAEIGVYGPNSKISTKLTRDGVESVERVWKVKPAKSHFVSTTAHDAELSITVNQPGTYFICK